MRSHLAESGITFQGDVTQYYQGVTNGGREERFRYGGHADYVFNADMGQVAGLQGMFIKVRGETQFGDFINNDVGSLLAANSSGLFPVQNEQTTAVTNILITQMFSEKFGVFAGKLDTLDGDPNAYAHGRGKSQFMNTALIATPIAFRTTPYSTWGTGFVVLGEDAPEPLFSFSVIDPRDFATEFNLDEIYSEGVTLSAELRFATDFLGKPGHQLFAGIWSSRDVGLLQFAPLLLLPNGPALPTSSDSWALYWNFDQQLVSNPCNPEKGWGVFGRAAIADEDTNPLEYFLSFGIGGNSPLMGRENDRFGIGWYYAATSEQLPGLLLDDAGQGVELFYNFEVNPSLHITPDLQFIDPAGRGIADATVAGIRVSLAL